jgi:hypothetical protein
MSKPVDRDALIAQVRTLLHARRRSEDAWREVEADLIWEIRRSYPENTPLTGAQIHTVLQRFVQNTNRLARARALLHGDKAQNWAVQVEGWVTEELAQQVGQ